MGNGVAKGPGKAYRGEAGHQEAEKRVASGSRGTPEVLNKVLLRPLKPVQKQDGQAGRLTRHSVNYCVQFPFIGDPDTFVEEAVDTENFAIRIWDDEGEHR